MLNWRVFLPVVLVVACGDDATMDPDPAAMTPTPFERQVARGQALYVDHCARCHGAMGEGVTAPPVVGAVGTDVFPKDPPASRQVRSNQFSTALDIFEFTSVNMPADAPGSLETQEYLDVLAFAIFANGIILPEPLSAATAPTIVINP